MAKKVNIGLDIGSTAVRAAEVVIEGDRRALRRFGQVGLPAGAVVEGEVRDKLAVTAAIRRLWQHGRFSGRSVVVGIGGQRAMVRQVEMPPMSDGELRSALKFKMGEFLPIPVDQAVVDFTPLPPREGGGADGNRRVLLVAAQRDVVVDQVAAVEEAGLRIQSVDSSSMALLRAARSGNHGGGGPGPGSGMEAVIGVGAELITVAVRDSGVPRFVRTVALTGGGGGLAGNEGLGGAPNGAGARSRPAGPRGAATGLAAPRVDLIVGEVRSSLEYLLSQSGTSTFDRALVTGGGAMLSDLVGALSHAVGVPVELAQPTVELDTEELALDAQALGEASSRWLTAVGLALWGTDAYGKLSLLPPEVAARREQRKMVVAAAAVVVAAVAAMGAVSVSKVRDAGSISSQITTSTAQTAALEAKIARLGNVLAVPQEVQARHNLAVAALAGDIDWVGTLATIEAALPRDVVPQTLSMVKTEATGATSAAPAHADAIVGTFQMTAQTRGGAAAVASLIDHLSRVKVLYGLWVTSTDNSLGVTQIDATAQVTGAALSKRAAELPGLAK